jgi:uncharacterized membrane protein
MTRGLLACACGFVVLFATLVLVYLVHGGPGDARGGHQHRVIRSYLLRPFAEAPDLAFLDLREARHLHDVKRRFDAAWVVAGVSVAGLAAVAVAGRRGGQRSPGLARAGRAAGLGLLVGLPLVGLVALVDFDAFWTAFHAVLFPDGGWRFPDDSGLLAIYPESYFAGFVAWGAGIVLAVATGLTVAGARRDQASATRSSNSSSK